MTTTYDQLESVVLPYMERYQTDLTKHDREAIEQYPDCPFLHYACDSNTHILMFQPFADYPADGEQIPYLFGQADRWHVVSQYTVMADYFSRAENNPDRYIVHHFDGKKLSRTTIKRACEIAREYRRTIEAQFNVSVNARKPISA